MIYELEDVKIAIVAGHAGKRRADPGATNPAIGDPFNTNEVEHTIPIATELVRKLQDLGAIARYIVGEVSETVAQINNFEPAIALSLHLNAGGGRGFELWHYPRSVMGIEFAEAIEVELLGAPAAWVQNGLEYRSRGLKPADPGSRARSFVAAIAGPALLIELGFLDNDIDERLINSALFREHTASAIARGVAAFAL